MSFAKSSYIQFFGGKTHPQKLVAKHIEKFLSHLATKGNFAAFEFDRPVVR